MKKFAKLGIESCALSSASGKGLTEFIERLEQIAHPQLELEHEK
jgi:hypothetical protein